MHKHDFECDYEAGKNKWNNTNTIYKDVRLYERQTGSSNYFSLRRGDLGLKKIHQDVYEALEAIVGDRANIDTSNPQPAAPRRGKRKASALDAEFQKTQEAVTEEEETRFPGDREEGSNEKAIKKGRKVALVLANVLKDGNQSQLKMMEQEEENKRRRHEDRMEVEREWTQIEQRTLEVEEASSWEITKILVVLVAKLPGPAPGPSQ